MFLLGCRYVPLFAVFDLVVLVDVGVDGVCCGVVSVGVVVVVVVVVGH